MGDNLKDLIAKLIIDANLLFEFVEKEASGITSVYESKRLN